MIVTSARLDGRRCFERVGQVAVAVGDRQHLGLAGGPDDGERSIVDFKCVLHGQAHLEGYEPGVGQVELERLVALRRDLKRDRVDERALLALLLGSKGGRAGLRWQTSLARKL